MATAADSASLAAPGASDPMDGASVTVITTITVLQTSKWLCKPKDPKEPKA